MPLLLLLLVEGQGGAVMGAQGARVVQAALEAQEARGAQEAQEQEAQEAGVALGQTSGCDLLCYQRSLLLR